MFVPWRVTAETGLHWWAWTSTSTSLAAADNAPASAVSPLATRSPDHSAATTNPTAPATRTPTGERGLDLVALLVLIALSAVVFTLAGPGAFTAVTSVGMGLYATWRSNHPCPPH